ncbi:MAG TPA: radical SAM protein [Tepidisphaeraceae bacterium]|nr:radical SAM protein [Tepidisphaeraceae bacterium]
MSILPLRQLPHRLGVVYGPIQSRRLGWSLGINVCGEDRRLCQFDCIYCQYPDPALRRNGLPSPHLLPAGDLIASIERGLVDAVARGVRIDSLTFAGNGDPSVHPDLPILVAAARRLVRKLPHPVPVSIFTNAARYSEPAFVDALGACDNPFVKLDAGDHETLAAIDQPRTGHDAVAMAEALRPLGNVIVQTMIVSGRVDNRPSVLGPGYARLVRRMRAREVQIGTIDKRPAGSGVLPVSEAELTAVATRLRASIEDIPVTVFYQDCPSGFPDVVPPRWTR